MSRTRTRRIAGIAVTVGYIAVILVGSLYPKNSRLVDLVLVVLSLIYLAFISLLALWDRTPGPQNGIFRRWSGVEAGEQREQTRPAADEPVVLPEDPKQVRSRRSPR